MFDGALNGVVVFLHLLVYWHIFYMEKYQLAFKVRLWTSGHNTPPQRQIICAVLVHISSI